jgi:hypothetical protein
MYKDTNVTNNYYRIQLLIKTKQQPQLQMFEQRGNQVQQYPQHRLTILIT